MKKGIILVLSLLGFVCVSAQERKLLDGKITAASDDLEGVYIINTTADITVASSKGGYFSIPAKVNDTLLFSSVQFVARYVAIKKDDLENDLFFVALEVLVRDLDEVTINKYRNLSAEALGIVPKGQKQYTPAERKLETAGDFKPIHLLGLLGGQLAVDPILNAINGRTKRLKKEIKIERRENMIDVISGMYSDEEIITEFNIPEEYVKGFIFYVVEDPELIKTISEKNNTMAKLVMSGLAVKYLDLIKNEE